MRTKATAGAVLAALVCLSAMARADEATPLPPRLRPAVRVDVSPREAVVVGDEVVLRLHAKGHAGDEITVPAQSVAPFEILGRSARTTGERGARVEHVFEIRLLALQPGTHRLHPLRVRVLTRDGTLGYVECPVPVIEVRSALGNEPNAVPKPATAPRELIEKDYTLLWIGGGILAAALLVWLTLLVSRWWRRRPQKPVATIQRPPWEVALESLAALEREQAGAFENGHSVDWVDRLSDVVRSYLGERFAFEGLESTTDEILRILKSRRTSARLSVEEIAVLLGECDLVKFAQAPIAFDHGRTLLGTARQVVQASISSSVVPQAPASPGSPDGPRREDAAGDQGASVGRT